jgi:hypothetical protein
MREDGRELASSEPGLCRDDPSSGAPKQLAQLRDLASLQIHPWAVAGRFEDGFTRTI